MANETIADIVAEKRHRADEIERDVAAKMASGKMVSDQYSRELIADIRREADRIEAAWKREREPKPPTIPEWIDHEESIADIAAVLRRYVLPSLAERLEAAWKRDRESLLTKQGENVNSGSVVYTGENKGGNAAAMREALELLNQLFDSCVLGTHYEMTADEMDKVDELYFKTKSALSAPPRNCDRYKDAPSAYADFIVPWKLDGHLDDVPTLQDFANWLFAPAEEGADA